MGSNGQDARGSLLHHGSATRSSARSSPRTLRYPRKPCCRKALPNLSEMLAARGKAKGLSEKDYHPFMKAELAFFPYGTFTSRLQKYSRHSRLVKSGLQRTGTPGYIAEKVNICIILQRKQTRSITRTARMNESPCGEGELRQLHPHKPHTTASALGLLRL